MGTFNLKYREFVQFCMRTCGNLGGCEHRRNPRLHWRELMRRCLKPNKPKIMEEEDEDCN